MSPDEYAPEDSAECAVLEPFPLPPDRPMTQSLTLDDYQRQAVATAKYPAKAAGVYPALGLCGEAGEFAEKLQQGLFPGGPPKEWDEVSCAVRDVHRALGLAAAAGKECERVKKVIRDKQGTLPAGVLDDLHGRFLGLLAVDDGEPAADLGFELGDVQWYVAAEARDLGYALSGVGRDNLAKLAGRAERGTLHGSGDNR